MKRHKKATHKRVSIDFLNNRANYSVSKGYTKQKWISLCETMLEKGFEVYLYEARQTVSKYVTVYNPGTDRRFKIRFSNHRPNKTREIENDCDFFVGITNFKTTTTEQALTAALEFLEDEQTKACGGR